MKYFLDTEFIEGTQKSWFGRNTKPTIDLISIGIVAEDGREFYAVSKDFNLKEAWNRWQQRTGEGDRNNIEPRLYWIRDNVLKPIFGEWFAYHNSERETPIKQLVDSQFNYTNFKKLLNKYGKTNKQIAEEVKDFCSKHLLSNSLKDKKSDVINQIEADATPKEFYGYYCDYDWVVFCWLFGKMIDLPKGFPMYCIDLKQTLDEKQLRLPNIKKVIKATQEEKGSIIMDLSNIKNHPNYPKQTNEHNALADAKWNLELYKFLMTI